MIPDSAVRELEQLWDVYASAGTSADRAIARSAYLETFAKYENREAIDSEPARVIADEIASDGVAPTG